MNRKTVFALAGAAVVAAALLALSQMCWVDPRSRVRGTSAAPEELAGGQGGGAGGSGGAEGAEGDDGGPAGDEGSGDGDGASEDASGEPMSEEEKAAAEEDRIVEEFDSMTDRWMEPGGREVSMDDVAEFARRFKRIPASRKEESLQRALNLLPDENVMLLAGVLLDKSLDREYLEMVYNDVLNRDEDVKRPILNEIYKDRTHPCWADTAWIFDATGEKPAGGVADGEEADAPGPDAQPAAPEGM